MPPHQYFDSRLRKDGLVSKRWASLSSEFRRLISFTFFEVLLTGQFRDRVKVVGPVRTPGGLTIDRYVMDMQFGLLVFGHVEVKSQSELALIDFHVDEFAMKMALRCNPLPH